MTLPARVEVGYIDASPGLDYHHNVQVAEAFIGNSQELANVNLPIVMTPDAVKQLAEYLRARGHIESRTVSFQTGWKYLYLHPDDVVTLEADGVSLTVRVTQMNLSVPAGVIKFQGVIQESTILTQSATGSAGSGLEVPVVAFPSNQKLVLLEAPPIHDGDDRLVVPVGSALRGDGVFRGAFLYRANPAGNYDDLIATFPAPSTLGVIASVLASTAPHNFDSASTLIVDLFQGALTSCTQAELVADPDKNLLAVKNSSGEVEYIQFTTATAGTATWSYTARYTLSGFLRGRFMTEGTAATHATGTDVLLMDASVQTVEFEPVDVGRTVSLKCVSAGQQVTDAATVSLTLVGRSLMPPAPIGLTGTRNSDNDLLIEWTRRARQSASTRGFNSPPVAEEREEYTVEIMSGATVKRTLQVLPPYQTDAVLEADLGSKFDQIAGNTATGAGTFLPIKTVQYASLQRLVRPGNFVHATLTATTTGSDTTGRASLSLLDAATEWRKQVVVPLIEVRVAEGSPNTTTIYVQGVSVYASTTHANGSRWTFEILNDRVRVFVDYRGAASVPVYQTVVAPVLPLRVFGQVRKTGSSAASVIVTTTPEPKAVYTAAQALSDGFTPANPVSVRVSQRSAIVGHGTYLQGTI